MFFFFVFSLAFLNHIPDIISAFINTYGYLAIFILMVLESATFPVPSEVVLPLAGLFAAKGILNFYVALAVSVVASMIGSLIDYAIGYYLGRVVMYKHLGFFHISKKSLESFESWFQRNGKAAIFITRLFPIIRTVVNFPAGFSKMRLDIFLVYSLAGILVWDVFLMAYGFLFLYSTNPSIILASIGLLTAILYVAYKAAKQYIK